MTPQRIQLSRRKGWRLPENAVKVARPTKWGNPYRVGECYPDEVKQPGPIEAWQAVALYRRWLMGDSLMACITRSMARRDLRGRDLACWCPLHPHGEYVPCHADVLLEVANR